MPSTGQWTYFVPPNEARGAKLCITADGGQGEDDGREAVGPGDRRNEDVWE